MTPRHTPEIYNFFDTTVGNCYHVHVEVPTPGRRTLYFFALVDTGANDLILPAAYLADFYPQGHPPTTTVGTAGGSAQLPIFRNHHFSVDSVLVSSDVLFAPLGHAAALCGRVPLMRCSAKFGLSRIELMRV